MKNILSLLACVVICIALVQYRVTNSDLTPGHKPLKITEWDAFGYYMYLPALGIYHDHKQLKWLTDIDKKYAVTGGNGWQAQKTENGNYVFKYLGGVAVMQAPFFLAAHYYAQHSDYPPDGFSPPYQYALGFGIIFYSLLALLLLRKILLQYFPDTTTAIILLMVALASNYIQYAAVDSGQSHGYLFVLYAVVMYATMQWHKTQKIQWAILTGYITGLATMSRPTEAIMLFIPLMWDTHTKEAAAAKWQMVRQNKAHIGAAMLAGFAGILPQLLYWKNTTGSYLYDVGSKWDFLSPHFRVLTGWEKGWFIYTPVTLLFIAGMFFMKQFPFRKSVLWFCLLNIYVIIGWHEWRYGGSYSTRALVQSYPMFALPFAAITDRIINTKWKVAYLTLCVYLLFVNWFQINQYNTTVLHYDDMNRKYYAAIYLNPHPDAATMSLLDNDEIIPDESKYKTTVLLSSDTAMQIAFAANATMPVATVNVSNLPYAENWLKVQTHMRAPGCLWLSHMHTELTMKDSVKQNKVRLYSPISKDSATNEYVSYMHIPIKAGSGSVKVYLSSPGDFRAEVQDIKISLLSK